MWQIQYKKVRASRGKHHVYCPKQKTCVCTIQQVSRPINLSLM